jgi:hypothetical protein
METAEGVEATTRALQAHVNAAAADYENGVIAMSPARALRAASNPTLKVAYRGSVIDNAATARVLADPALSGTIFATPNFTFGADFFDSSGNWWDMTTESQWSALVARYARYFGGPGIRLTTGG